MAYYSLGQKAKSDALLEDFIAKYGQEYSYNIAYIYAWRREPDRAFEWLDKAVAYHDTGMVEIGTDPIVHEYR